MMIDFRIATFLAVCNYMNFTRAAEELHITQPAVSQHIRYLEEQYDTTLFIHEGKKIRLSPSGKLLLQSATTIKNDEQLLISRMHQANNHNIPLHFGATITIGEFVISRYLAGYMKKHPASDIKMIVGNTDNLLRELKQGSIQFAIVEGYFSREKYDSLTFSTEEFIAVCASGHQFHCKKAMYANLDDPAFHLTVKDLKNEPLLLREEGSGTRDILEKNLVARNMSLDDFKHKSEIGNMNAIVQLLIQDCGITFLYKAAVQSELEKGILKEIPLSDFKLCHDFAFIWEKGSMFGDVYQEVYEELKNG